MKPEKPYNLFTFFALYIAQTVPMSFFSSALPVLMRQGDYSLTTIALLKLIKLPWIIKVFWSPWIDRNSETVRDYKRWIIISETVYAALILIVAALDLQTHFALMIPLIFLALTASATQDIATDALAARSFERGDKGLLNSMQSIGSFAGSMVGGGFLLLLLRKTGWEILLPWMAVFVLLALLPLYFNKKLKLRRRQTRRRANLKDMYLFFKQKGMPKHILFLFLFYSGIIGILSVLHPLLVDLGYEIEQIGAMVGIFGASCGIVGSFLAGLAIRKAGRKVFRRIIAFFIICTAAYFLAVNSSGLIAKTVFVFIGIALVWGTYGMASTMMYTTAMDAVRDGREGTDFTLQLVIVHLCSMVCVMICSGAADRFGYDAMFSTELFLAIVSFIFVWHYRPFEQKELPQKQ